MAKIYVCPRHKISMSISNKKLVLGNSAYTVCVGICPKCSVMYINQRLMSCASITVEGQRYEYLHSLPSIQDIQQQEELAYLREQNDMLSRQLEEIKEEMTEAVRGYEERINEIQTKHQEEIDQTVKKLESKYAKEIGKIVSDQQSRINRLNDTYQKAVALQKAALIDLEAERQLTTALQCDNAVLKGKVEQLTKQLSEAKRPIKRIIFVDEKLYVCGGTIKCEKYNHQREEVTGIIDTMRGKPVAMTVCHCKDCNLYYVRDAVFESYREKHGTLLGKFIRKKDGMEISHVAGYGELAIESILHMNGYNVNQTVNLSVGERHRILTYIIESGIMSKHDIRTHLAYLIKMNQSNPSKEVAVSRWRIDIQWVNDYHIGKQESIWLSGTAMYKYRDK